MYKNLCKQRIYIYGNDYKTKDGTCVRDYIHIKDICNAIEKSIKYLMNKQKSITFNIGSNKGLSNKKIINYMKNFTNSKINIKYVNKRKGDVASLVCNSNKIRKVLGWISKNSNLQKIINDEINWIKKFKKKGLHRKFKNYLN
mgnify:FL=1